jgi:hypothetical protein
MTRGGLLFEHSQTLCQIANARIPSSKPRIAQKRRVPAGWRGGKRLVRARFLGRGFAPPRRTGRDELCLGLENRRAATV